MAKVIDLINHVLGKAFHLSIMFLSSVIFTIPFFYYFGLVQIIGHIIEFIVEFTFVLCLIIIFISIMFHSSNSNKDDIL